MQINPASAINLLHVATSGVLATHSLQMPGYPFATTLPFAVDEHHCPAFLVSRLAEHTKNLMVDNRASLLASEPGSRCVLRGARMTVVGDVQPFVPSNELVTRYLRYQPDAKQYLELGDFVFFRLTPQRIRYIAGFGEMGWVDAAVWRDVETLSLADEETVYRAVAPDLPQGVRMLGIDAYGFDVEHGEKRDRHHFPDGPVLPADLADVIRRFIVTL